MIDRSKFPTAADEYTPDQRRMINARLAEAEKGPTAHSRMARKAPLSSKSGRSKASRLD